jgi:squalene-hopene/tetraprenyl-beta-curcumene cyclase
MKLVLALVLITPAISLRAQTTLPDSHASLKQEIQLAYQRGLEFLRSQQDASTGQWGKVEPVAISGLAATAFMVAPGRSPADEPPTEAASGLDFLMGNAKPDGGIYTEARANYNTAIALNALLLDPSPANEAILLAARRFLIDHQIDLDSPGTNDNPLDGGMGYGASKGNHADLSNTHFALEALYNAEKLLADRGDALRDEASLNYAAAIDFIQRCQNRPESNPSPWVSKDPADAGGFIYNPVETRGGKVEGPDGRVTLRSYGSISYAGLLSFIYAGLDADDPRVEAVLQWLSQNYTVDENPGLGEQGLYYYYHTMAKALTTAGRTSVELSDGQQIDWRNDLATRLLNLQKGDGSWVNQTGRWMESDPLLTTSYVLLALSKVHASL